MSYKQRIYHHSPLSTIIHHHPSSTCLGEVDFSTTASAKFLPVPHAYGSISQPGRRFPAFRAPGTLKGSDRSNGCLAPKYARVQSSVILSDFSSPHISMENMELSSHWVSNQKCPFGKNRRAGDWEKPSSSSFASC